MAVFIHRRASAADLATSKKVHADFLEQYGVSPDETPLVTYDYRTGHFELFSEEDWLWDSQDS